ncbi:hypothetical protein LR48_Vigan406s026100 [Vigna angularis]|uniref:Transposase, Ptta/En/Spm, plant n=1 Tax=Phaseolus angularis TaxID=3914 RepID=A0A0L9TAQ0_PHAAN|nr:hypothetical protein LR48_Vigan406s026100 [Vigna angularis]
MTRFNKEIGSSNQPTTPTSTSTGRSVPPPLQVPGLTPTPHQVPTSTPTSIGTSLPPPLQVSGLTPTPYQVPTDQMASLSPIVVSNPSTPTNIAPSPGIVDQLPQILHHHLVQWMQIHIPVQPPMTWKNVPTVVQWFFYPTKTASKAITATIKQQFDEPWLTWGQIPKTVRDVFFDRFKRKVSWNPEDEEKWNMSLYRQKCETTKKNRTSEKGGCLHTRGFISVHEDAIRLSQELGRSVHVDEIFQQTHIRQSTGEFVDERSRWTHELFEAKFSQIRSEIASVGASACSPLDPTEEERLRNRCWLEAAGGKYKGRVYGIGNVNYQDDYVDSYIQQTQTSSTQQQNVEEIVNLKSQLQEYGQQLQKFEGFICVILPFLPPSAVAAAQDFFNIQIPQAQNHAPNDVQPEQQPPN